MEVEFPSSDDDSIYFSENDVVLERPPLSPDAIILTGPLADELDEVMDIIDEEEVSSEEEDMSEASTQPLTDSLDPISDDDMIDVSSKPHLTDDVMDDSQSPKPDPSNVAVHTSLITPSSSDDPPAETISTTNNSPLRRDDSDKDNMVSVPGMRHFSDTPVDGKRDTKDPFDSPKSSSKPFVVDEQAASVSLTAVDNTNDDVFTDKFSVQTTTPQPATEVTDLKSTDQTASTTNSNLQDEELSHARDSPEPVIPTEKKIINSQEEQPRLKTANTSIVVFDASESSETSKNSSSPNQQNLSSFTARLAAFGTSIVKKSPDQKSSLNEQEAMETVKEPKSKAEVSSTKQDELSATNNAANFALEPRDNELKDTESAVEFPPQSFIDNNDKTEETQNLGSSNELPNKDMINKLVESANSEMYADKPSSPSSDDLDDMFFDAQTVPESTKQNYSPASNSPAEKGTTDLTAEEPHDKSGITSKEDPKSPGPSNDEARQLELAQASLDVPDVEDVTESKKRPEKDHAPKESMDENDLEDLDVGVLGPQRSARAGDSSSPIPDFPAMDEIDINRSVEKSGDQFIPHQPRKKREPLNLEIDEDDTMYGADEFVEEKPVDLGNVPESVKNGSTITKTELTTPLKTSKSGKKPSASKSVGSGGFGIFSMSSFYRAFKKPSKGKDSESETAASSERDLDLGKSSETDGSSEKRKKRSKKEIARDKERVQSTVSESVRSTRGSVSVAEGEAYLEWRTPEELAEEERHLRLEETLKSQIATLRSARSGFVDLALLTPMTEKTLAAVDLEAKRILSQLPEIERRKEVLGRQVEILEITTEAELSAKEKTLVAAKVKVAEAKCELDKLRHELFVMKRDIAKPGKAAAKERLRLSMRREKAEKDLRAATESKETMERNLEQRKAMLKTYRNEVSRLEKSVRDVNGDWA